jgi:hypothetical protein
MELFCVTKHSERKGKLLKVSKHQEIKIAWIRWDTWSRHKWIAGDSESKGGDGSYLSCSSHVLEACVLPNTIH